MYDPERAVTVLMSGQLFAGSPNAEIWEWNGSSWARRAPGDLEGDELPPARAATQGAYDAFRKELIMFSGWDGKYFDDTWGRDAGAHARPAHTMHAAFAAAAADASSAFVEVASTWYAGGEGSDGACSLVPGAHLRVWDHGRWFPTGTSNTVGPNGPFSAMTWSTATAPYWSALDEATRQAYLRRLFVGPQQEVAFSVEPIADGECASAPGWITTDYAEIKVRYRRP